MGTGIYSLSEPHFPTWAHNLRVDSAEAKTVTQIEHLAQRIRKNKPEKIIRKICAGQRLTSFVKHENLKSFSFLHSHMGADNWQL